MELLKEIQQIYENKTSKAGRFNISIIYCDWME